MRNIKVEKNILLIDTAFNPIRAIPTKRALKLQYLKKAYFIAPEILQLSNYIHRKSFVLRYSRRSVYGRDKNQCQYCGKKLSSYNRTIDHVIPLGRGGDSSFENCVTSCRACNLLKGAKLPHEIGFKLLKQPRIPNIMDILREQHKNLFSKFNSFLFKNSYS